MNDFFDRNAARDAVFNAIRDASHKPTAKVKEDWDDDTPELDSFLTDLTVTNDETKD